MSDILVRHEDMRFIRLAIVIRIAQHHDRLSCRDALINIVVNSFCHPKSPQGIHVHGHG